MIYNDKSRDEGGCYCQPSSCKILHEPSSCRAISAPGSCRAVLAPSSSRRHIIEHLNVLNTSMQSRKQVVTDLYDTIRALQKKLFLRREKLFHCSAVHLPSLTSLPHRWDGRWRGPGEGCGQGCSSQLRVLGQFFFTIIGAMKRSLKLSAPRFLSQWQMPLRWWTGLKPSQKMSWPEAHPEDEPAWSPPRRWAGLKPTQTHWPSLIKQSAWHVTFRMHFFHPRMIPPSQRMNHLFSSKSTPICSSLIACKEANLLVSIGLVSPDNRDKCGCHPSHGRPYTPRDNPHHQYRSVSCSPLGNFGSSGKHLCLLWQLLLFSLS